MRSNKIMLKIAILVVTFVQMAPNGLSPALSDIAAAFPEASASTIQLIMTLPGIFVVILSLLSAWLTAHISKKVLIGSGSFCIILTGILGTLFHSSLNLLFAWAVLMGIGMGLVSALTASLISDHFDGQEKTNLMGLQTGATNIGGMIMTAVGGFLTAFAWHLDYMVYMIAVPGLLLLLFFVPKDRPVKTKEASAGNAYAILKNKVVWIYVLFSTLVLLLFNAGPTNLSMYVTEFQIGGSVLAGSAAAFFLLGGALMGCAFGAFSKKLGIYTIPLGFLLVAIGFGILILRPSVACLLIGCLLAGMSISLVTPQCLMQTSTFGSTPQEMAITAGVVLAGSNIGSFFTPQITNIAQLITGSGSTIYRFEAGIILALFLTVITFIATWRLKKQTLSASKDLQQ